MKVSLRTIVSWALLLVFPGVCFAAESSALAQGFGEVQVNGTRMARTTTVFSGDKLSTGQGSVSLSAPGLTAVIAQNSRVEYARNGLNLLEGTAVVTSQPGQVSSACSASVEAVDKNSKYTIRRQGTGIVVTAQSGRVRVRNGGDNQVINAGQSITLPGDCAVAGAQPQQGGISAPSPGVTFITVAVGVIASILPVFVIIGMTQNDRPASPFAP